MVFSNTIPQSTDRLVISQQDLLNNNAQLDTSFDVDHYKFTDATADNGKHKTVTHVDQTTDPATTATELKSYAIDTGTLGLMSWARSSDSAGTGGGVTGISGLHSDGAVAVADTASINLLDLSSLNDCCGEIVAWASGTTGTPAARYSSYMFFFDSTAAETAEKLKVQSFATTSGLSGPIILISTDGNSTIVLTNKNGSALNIYWTIKINRYVV